MSPSALPPYPLVVNKPPEARALGPPLLCLPIDHVPAKRHVLPTLPSTVMYCPLFHQQPCNVLTDHPPGQPNVDRHAFGTIALEPTHLPVTTKTFCFACDLSPSTAMYCCPPSRRPPCTAVHLLVNRHVLLPTFPSTAMYCCTPSRRPPYTAVHLLVNRHVLLSRLLINRHVLLPTFPSTAMYLDR